jgi:predicted RNase H-like nuclease (RuvC/YqgF family)
MSQPNRIGITSHVLYKKDYHKTPALYKALTVSMLKVEDRVAVRAAIKPLTSIEDVKLFITLQLQLAERLSRPSPWALRWMDQLGRIQVLAYKGVEVALFFERTIEQITPGPGEPIPECEMKDPSDRWQRLDITGPSARQANVVLKNKHEQLEELNKVLTQRCSAQEIQISSLETTMFKTEDRRRRQIENLQKKVTKLNEELAQKQKRKRGRSAKKI